MSPSPCLPSGYELGFQIGSGGMASVRYGRRVAAGGIAHAVAIKELHPHLASNPALVAMFFDEARLAARVVHANVVSVVDVVSAGERVWTVMQYVEGESLANLAARAAETSRRVPVGVAAAIALDVLAGLDAAHRATDERGQPLGIVHRDVSPHNVLVGADGVARVLDFGVAKARGRAHETRDGQVKGKLAYMAPEQLGGEANASTDVYAAAIVLWELLAGRRLFEAETDLELMGRVLSGATESPAAHADVPAAIDAVVMKALAQDPRARFASAAEMARALSTAIEGRIASRHEISAWVESLAADALAERRRLAAEMADRRPAVDGGSPPVSSAPPLAFTVSQTQVMTRPLARSAPPRLARRLVASALVAVAAALGVVAVAGASSLRAGDPPPPPAVAAEVAPAGEAPAPRDVSSDPPAGPAAEAPAPGAPASAPAAPPRAKRVDRRRVAPMKRAATQDEAPSAVSPPAIAAPPSPGESCDPPFVVDASGVRTYKRACIR